MLFPSDGIITTIIVNPNGYHQFSYGPLSFSDILRSTVFKTFGISDIYIEIDDNPTGQIQSLTLSNVSPLMTKRPELRNSPTTGKSNYLPIRTRTIITNHRRGR